MDESKVDQKLRKLGRLELFHHVRSNLGLYNCVGTTAQYVIRSAVLRELGRLDVVAIAVLKLLICQHPIMGVNVIDEKNSNGATWKRLKTIDLRQVVTFKTIYGDQKFIEDEHQKPFDLHSDLPLWRVVIANHVTQELASPSHKEHERDPETIFDVGFFFSHAIADGTSGVAFHLDFLDALNALGTKGSAVDEPLEFLAKVPELSLLPPLDETTWPITLMFLAKTVFKTFVWSGQVSKGHWLGPPVVFDPDQPPKTHFLSMSLDSIAAGNILQLCREEKTSVTALLTFLIARRLALEYPDHSDFPASIAISLRHFTGLATRQMGDQVSSVQVPCSVKGLLHFIPGENMHWDTVREYKKIIHASASSPKDQIVGLLKYAGDLISLFKNKKRENAFEISNIGLVDGGMDGTGIAKFSKFIFSQSANVTGDPYVFSIASVKNGDMCVALTWQEGILEEAKARNVIDGLQTDLQKLAIGGIPESIT